MADGIPIEDTAALLGVTLPKEVTRTPKPVCPECGGDLHWVVEITGRNPFGSGYDILLCEDCDHEVERQWAGF